jgi:hypothetical protein
MQYLCGCKDTVQRMSCSKQGLFFNACVILTGVGGEEQHTGGPRMHGENLHPMLTTNLGLHLPDILPRFDTPLGEICTAGAKTSSVILFRPGLLTGDFPSNAVA